MSPRQGWRWWNRILLDDLEHIITCQQLSIDESLYLYIQFMFMMFHDLETIQLWDRNLLAGAATPHGDQHSLMARDQSLLSNNLKTIWRSSQVGWRPSQVGWRSSQVGWRSSQVGWRPSLLGWIEHSECFLWGPRSERLSTCENDFGTTPTLILSLLNVRSETSNRSPGTTTCNNATAHKDKPDFEDKDANRLCSFLWTQVLWCWPVEKQLLTRFSRSPINHFSICLWYIILSIVIVSCPWREWGSWEDAICDNWGGVAGTMEARGHQTLDSK